VRHLEIGTGSSEPENIWREHSLVDLVLAACDQSDDQTEISGLVDEFLRDGSPGRAIGERRALPVRRALPSRTCTRAA
jgi:hypothetical protein